MQTFALEIWDDETSLVTFYTVRKLGNTPEQDAKQSETDKFFEYYENITKHDEALNRLADLLFEVIEIGLDYKHFPLRLFCLKLNEEIVVLFNGGEKTSQNTQNSNSLSLKFKEAQEFGKRIEAALINKEIIIEKRVIKSGFEDAEIIL